MPANAIMESLPRPRWLLAAALLLGLTCCADKHNDNVDPSVDPFAPSAQDRTPDPLREAHERGWLWAQQNGATLVTDCLGLTDSDERYGCATFVNRSH